MSEAVSQSNRMVEAAADPDPARGLAAVEVLEELQVDNARAKGWSWCDIALVLGVTKQGHPLQTRWPTSRSTVTAEVGVCLRCAHFLHQQARGREDGLRPSLTSRLRNQLRSARGLVMRRRWHQRPIIGKPLRWLRRHLP